MYKQLKTVEKKRKKEENDDTDNDSVGGDSGSDSDPMEDELSGNDRQ
jgi:hypothetical protein